jgi:hypothetical protein
MLRRSALALTSAALVLGSTTASSLAYPAPPPPENLSPIGVAVEYVAALNAGMMSGDFSPLATLYARTAMVVSNSPSGRTGTYRGLGAITRFYRATWEAAPGFRWTEDSVRPLSGTVILMYEHSSGPGMRVPARRADLFVVRGSRIVSQDSTTYFAGGR